MPQVSRAAPHQRESKNTARQKRLFEIRSLLVLIESAIHIVGAPFLAGFNYPSNVLSTIARVFFIDIRLDDNAFIYVYCVTLFYIFLASSLSFIPTSKLLLILPSQAVRIGSGIFTLVQSAIVVPILRFLFSLFDCQYDEIHGQSLVRGHYHLVCMSELHITLANFSIITTVLFIISTVRLIQFRFAPVENAKRDFVTMYDHRNTHYAIFQLVQSLLYGIALGFSSYIPHAVIASMFLVLIVTSIAFVLLYDPFYDRRMSMIRVGIDATALVGIILAFAIIFDDKSRATSIMNLHVLLAVAFPLGTWIGSNICRQRAKASLSTVVKSNTQELDLSKKFLGDPKFFFQYFLPWLMNNHSVDKMCLKWNEIDKQKFVCLATAVTQNQKLRHLDLSYNQINFAITEAGCGRETLIGLLQANTVLRTLILDKNPLGDETTEILCMGLAQNKSIMCLHLADCNLTLNAGEHLRHLLQHNKTIQEINLSWNHLGPTGVSTLGLGLKENSSLKKLDLTWNRFGNQGYEALKDALITNSTIEVLIVSSNNLSGQQKKILEDLTRRDRTGGSAQKENIEIDTQKLLQMYGGPQTLQKVVDKFYFKIVNDSNIKHYFANMSIHRMQHLQFNFLLEFLFNGPSYRGRNMKLAHASLRISDNDFDAVLLHLSTAFDEIMPQLETNIRDLLMDKLENLREDIVSMKSDGDGNLSKEFVADELPEKKRQSDFRSIKKTVSVPSPVIAANLSKTDDIDLESGPPAEFEPSSGCPFSLSAADPTQQDSDLEIKQLVSEMWNQFGQSDVLAKFFKDPNSRMKKMFVPLFKTLLYHPEKSHSSLPQSLRSAQVASFHSIYNLSEAEFEEFIRLTQVAALNVHFGAGDSVIEGLKKYKNLLCQQQL